MGFGIGDKMGTNVIESSDIVQVSCKKTNDFSGIMISK